MKFTSVFISTLASGLTFIDGSAAQCCKDPKNDCYRSGHAFYSASMRVHAENACKGWSGNKGAFQGTFKPGEKKSVCVANADPNTHLVMEVRNEDESRSWDINDNDCYKEFLALINDCNYDDFAGGEGQGGT